MSAPPVTGAASADAADSQCFHCGLPLPAGGLEVVVVDGQPRPMCCPGCAAVCRSILDAGLGDYYRFRSRTTGRAADPVPDELLAAGVYDLPAVQEGFVSDAPEGGREAALSLAGITCAACAWLIERQLRSVPGVAEAQVNFATHRARVRFDAERTRVSDLLAAVRAVGYEAHPYDPARAERELDQERRRRLRELGLAGVLAVQIMMLALAGYLGDWTGMEAGIRQLLSWAGLVLAVPVVLVCARPFARGALRDLRARSPGMDVPVTLAIGVAFGGSVVATVSGEGHVYYDSLAMFTFLLLLSRYGEFAARRRAAAGLLDTLHVLPAFACRLDEAGGQQMTPVASLAVGDRVLLRPGDTVPADGVVVAGTSSVDESLLTGESHPRRRAVGDRLTGGAVNVESPLTLEVQRVGRDTVLSGLMDLAERARDARPRMARLADRVAAVFVVVLLLATVAVAAWWWQQDPARVLPVTVALLVATCPCALSLATPTALTAGAGALTRLGLLPVRADVVEALARVDHVVLDKTGTLTLGRPRLAALEPLGDLDEEACLALAAGIEQVSEHPLARAVMAAADARGVAPAALHEHVNEPGAGLTASDGQAELLLGGIDWVTRRSRLAPPADRIAARQRDGATCALLARGGRLLALLVFEDARREGAAELVAALARSGIGVTLASGDSAPAVATLAGAVGIEDWHAALRPEQKLALVESLQGRGRRVAMLGDGINDVPVLAGADVSVAMQGGAAAAGARADALLVSERLAALAEGLAVARRTVAVMRQNMAWAVGYNLLALPLAAAGWLAPWMAAVGMSASSLVVVGNALRARRTETA